GVSSVVGSRMGDGYGRGAVDGVGWVVGGDRAVVAAAGAALPLSGSQALARPRGLAGHPVCAAQRCRLGALAAGAWLRLGLDVLAAYGRVATRGCVGSAARAAAWAVA